MSFNLNSNEPGSCCVYGYNSHDCGIHPTLIEYILDRSIASALHLLCICSVSSCRYALMTGPTIRSFPSDVWSNVEEINLKDVLQKDKNEHSNIPQAE